MGFTQTRNGRLILIAATVLLFGAATFAAALQFSNPARRAQALAVVLKCSDPACGETLRTSREDVNSNTTLNPEDLSAPGLKCPKCGKNTQASAMLCPNDGTIFIARTVTGAPRCPKCGYDKEAADRAALVGQK